MWNKKRDKIFLFYIEFGNGVSPFRQTKSIQIGILSIGTYLKEKGYNVQTFFDCYPDTDELKRLISWERVRVIGFYTTMDNICRVQALTDFIKENFPKIIVIFGGPLATIRPALLLEEGRADIVVRYEGEYTMEELMDYYYHDKGSLEDIKGITYRDGNEIKHNPDRPFIEDLDELPILDRDLVPFKEDYPILLTGRGCPYNCTFCFQGTGHYYRMRSVENIMKEVDGLLERYADPVYISFDDDVFITDRDRALALCRELKKRKELRPGFHWFSETRANILYKYPELIKEMKEAGIAVLQFGTESANKKMLEAYNKMITTEQVEFTVKKCVEEDIFQIATTFMLGGPFESRETVEENINFAKKLIRMAPGRIRIVDGFLIPLPGTPIGDHPEKYGIILLKPYWKTGNSGGSECISETVNLKRGELLELKKVFDRELMITMEQELMNIPRKQVEAIFSMLTEGIQALWYDLLSSNTALKRYFNFKDHGIYKTFHELKDFDAYFPQRTDFSYELSEDRITLDRFGRKYLLNPFESRILILSAGRIRFREMVSILKEEFPESSTQKILDFYRKMDDIYGIVFAKV
ncbi:MAG: radical SAM protein [Candidatus Eremiobacterota bacterium]